MPGEIENAGDQPQQQQAANGWSTVKTIAFRMFIMYMIMSFFRGNSNTSTNVSERSNRPALPPGKNLFFKGTLMDLYVYVSEDEDYNKFNNDDLLWQLTDIEYGNWNSGPHGDASHTFSTSIVPSEKVQSNSSIFIHVYITKLGSSPNPKDPIYKKKNVLYTTKALNKYKRRRMQKTKNLLTGQSESQDFTDDDNETSKVEILSHWHPNLTIAIVDDHTAWKDGAVPAPLDQYIKFDEHGDYYPVLFLNDYWNLQSDFMPINSTVESLELNLVFTPMSLFKWQMYASQSMKNKWNAFLMEAGGEEDDQDAFKKAMLDTNPYLLGLTILVSLVHSVFEFLAFKNDIQFWRSRDSLEGLSVRSVFFNVFTSLIVVLYVLDNETNTIVRFSCGIGLVIELWKITKVVHVSLNFDQKLFGFIPIKFEERSSYKESPTKEYDRMAFKYLSILLFPLVIGYAIYSLFYNEHRSWYSFILSTMYGFLLMFGFIMMTPQLFINYKLKSVAHLPWRMLTYKALNTFIDDIFAFVIQMPTLYRIGCLRDDVIFFIYLYQKYKYPVDKKRTNEFGVTGEQIEEASKQTSPAANGHVAGDEPTKSLEEKKDD